MAQSINLVILIADVNCVLRVNYFGISFLGKKDTKLNKMILSLYVRAQDITHCRCYSFYIVSFAHFHEVRVILKVHVSTHVLSIGGVGGSLVVLICS